MSDFSQKGSVSPVADAGNEGIIAHSERPGWMSTAFLVEALVLLVVLIASMAVFTQLFSQSAATARHAERMTSAVLAAQNAAEEFSSNPAAVAGGKQVGSGVAAGVSQDDGLAVTCDVESESESAGTLYTACITVSDDSGQLYQLNAKRYVSGVK